MEQKNTDIKVVTMPFRFTLPAATASMAIG